MFFSVIGKVQGLGKSSDQKENLDNTIANKKKDTSFMKVTLKNHPDSYDFLGIRIHKWSEQHYDYRCEQFPAF